MAHAQKIPLWQRIADTMRDTITRKGLPPNAGISLLAAEHHVSLRTMWKAIQQLSREGLIVCKQGRRIEVADRAKNPAIASAPNSAKDRFYQSVKDRIIDGTFRIGRQLPKVAYFTTTEGVSSNTIAGAFARLSSEGLITKRGKKWFAGKQPSPGHPTRKTRKFARVLWLTPAGWESQNFYNNTFILPFSSALVSELHDHRIMLSLAFFEKAEGTLNDGEEPVPSGVDELKAYVKELGEDYLGTLLYCGWGVPESAAGVIRMLAGFGKPVIDFDHTDKHEDLAREICSRGKTRYYRCRLDEAGAARTALQSLADRGHRIVGLPIYSSPIYNWVPRRVSILQQAADECKPRIRLVTHDQRENFWKFEGHFDPGHYAEELRKALEPAAGPHDASGLAHQQSLKALLLANTPSIVNLLNTKGLSALIALNDTMAKEIHLWCKFAGMRVPDDISLVSFDNAIDHYHQPISTVDFGFARMGYQAAHVFIGDIPIRSGMYGDIPGECTLIDKGSVGAVV